MGGYSPDPRPLRGGDGCVLPHSQADQDLQAPSRIAVRDYEAIHRLPLGVAVTLEFAGPLAVALAGARQWSAAGWAVLAAAGVAAAAGISAPGAIGVAGILFGLAAVALLCDVLAYTLQADALRRMPRSLFSILTSTEPAAGAILGLLALGQRITLLQWAGIVAVVTASAAAPRAHSTREARTMPGHHATVRGRWLPLGRARRCR